MSLAPKTTTNYDVAEKIQWDFDYKKEFSGDRKVGFAFLIDVWNGKSNLVLYRIGPFNSYTNEIELQPPVSMLNNALAQQGYSNDEGGLYNINDEIRTWINNNLL